MSEKSEAKETAADGPNWLPRFVLWLRIEWLEWRISRIEERGVGNFSPWNVDLDKHGELTEKQIQLMEKQNLPIKESHEV
jgi:hypothetical protein